MIVLSYDRNRLDDPAPATARPSLAGAEGRRWRASRCWKADGFEGAFEYHDAQMYAPERIALEIFDGCRCQRRGDRQLCGGGKTAGAAASVEGCSVRDSMTGARFDIRAKTDAGGGRSLGRHVPGTGHRRAAAHRLLRSKGIHLLVAGTRPKSALTSKRAAVISLPCPGAATPCWRTTDTEFTGDPATVGVTETDIDTIFWPPP